MLKLMKYEFRKMRTPLWVMLIILMVLEGGFIVGEIAEKYVLSTSCLLLILLMMAVVYGYILIAAIVSYSRELKDRSGYLIFMTPVRTISVVTSKLLSAVVLAVLAGMVFGICGGIDCMYLFERADLEIFLEMLGEAGIKLTEMALMSVYMIFSMLISMVSTICTAYLAITLSATVMNHHKNFWRGLVSFGLFVALSVGNNWLNNRLIDLEVIETVQALYRYLGLSVLYGAVVSAAFAAISTLLLDKRVNL